MLHHTWRWQMSDLGKIFIFEKKANYSKNYQENFDNQGFFTFSTDNLFLLTQYAKELNPDIVIINLPNSITLSAEDLFKLENLFCNLKTCPQIYINQPLPIKHKPQIHQLISNSENLSYKQILSIIQDSNSQKILH